MTDQRTKNKNAMVIFRTLSMSYGHDNGNFPVPPETLHESAFPSVQN